MPGLARNLTFAVCCLLATTAGAVTAPVGRLVVLGFDGVDAELTEKMIAEGKLPHLARLAANGGYARLAPTTPAQTPVSWATFTTGRDPGGTRIFDFLRRDPQTYLPTFAVAEEGRRPLLLGRANRPAAVALGIALVSLVALGVLAVARRRRRWPVVAPAALIGAAAGWIVGGWLPAEIPAVISRRAGTPFWHAAGEHGVAGTVAHIPVTFPAAPFPHGHLLAGLGVPDLRGRIGSPAYYTSDPGFTLATDNEFSVEIIRMAGNAGVIESTVIGPLNRLSGSPPRLEVPLRLEVAADRTSLELATCGQRFTLRPGQWSGWVKLVFPFNPLVKAHGWVRFKLIRLEPHIGLYLQPISPDPVHAPPGFDISAPRAWAGELYERFGPFKTVGWAIDTWAPSEKVVDEETFWQDIELTVGEFRGLLRHFLASDDRLLVHYFEYTDRLGHILWRAVDPDHPAHEAATAQRLRGMIEDGYVLMDDIVGEVAATLGPGDVLLVLSDHGFSTWRRSFHIDTWLAREGYLALTGGGGPVENLENLFDRGEFWPNVDWRRSRAYHLGLGGLYVNLAGREGSGSVAPGAEYERLRRELAARLEAVVDPETGQHPVSRVFLREEVYRAFDPQLIPDLIVTTSRGYRISWQSALGGMPDRLFEDNARVWSGDHCTLDPEVVPGVLFSSRPLERRQLAMIDVNPTILRLLRVKPPEEPVGQPFL
jgi:predicted AlkP superfamily phosphohydrolase/phosphomutase